MFFQVKRHELAYAMFQIFMTRCEVSLLQFLVVIIVFHVFFVADGGGVALKLREGLLEGEDRAVAHGGRAGG